MEKVTKSDAEWQKILTPEQFRYCAGRAPSWRSPASTGTTTSRGLSLRRLRPPAVRLGDQVRVRHRLAELLAADRSSHVEIVTDSPTAWCAGGCAPLRRASGPSLRRRSQADRPALLHELGLARLHRGEEVHAGQPVHHHEHSGSSSQHSPVSHRAVRVLGMADVAVGDAPLPDRLLDRRDPGNGSRDRARLGQRGHDRRLDRARVPVRLRADAAPAGAERTEPAPGAAGSRSHPTPRRSH